MKLFVKLFPLYIYILTITGIVFGGFPVFAQSSQCTQDPIVFTEQQRIDLEDFKKNPSLLHEYFQDAEYLLIDFSLESCEHCLSIAQRMNTNTVFQSKVSGSGSCELVSLIHSEPNAEGSLIRWLQTPQVNGPTSFVGLRSRKVSDEETSWYNVPTVYGGPSIAATPTFVILNRNGDIVAMKEGGIPELFDQLCVPNSCNGLIEPITGNVEIEQGTGSCGCGGGSSSNGGSSSATSTTSSSSSSNGGSSSSSTTSSSSSSNGGSPSATSTTSSSSSSNGGSSSSNGTTTNSPTPPPPPSSEGPNPVAGELEKGRLQIDIPRSKPDIVSNDPFLYSGNSKKSLNGILKLGNEWMWIAMMVILFGVLIYAGFKLITSLGDSEKTKTALMMIVYVIGGFLLALLSWAIISLVAGMFA